ncbi:hypothetical protein FD725_02395 [Nostoc sp. TCL26-01]|nr:hypothetical protein FD725_02395 [Nostoc sp. TCL26-01]
MYLSKRSCPKLLHRPTRCSCTTDRDGEILGAGEGSKEGRGAGEQGSRGAGEKNFLTHSLLSTQHGLNAPLPLTALITQHS